MTMSRIDQTALAEKFAQASAQQDDALRQAVQQFTTQTLQSRELTAKSIRDVLKTLTQAASREPLFDTVAKTVAGGAQSIREPWSLTLGVMKLKGSATGANSAAAIEQSTERAHEALRKGRALQQSSVGLWMEHYAALVSGVSIGMSGALSANPESAQPPLQAFLADEP